jgi:hypothetical protein
MAEQQQVPTFKLVLVGDGGTGKVRVYRPQFGSRRFVTVGIPSLPQFFFLPKSRFRLAPGRCFTDPRRARLCNIRMEILTRKSPADHLCQASLDW